MTTLELKKLVIEYIILEYDFTSEKAQRMVDCAKLSFAPTKGIVKVMYSNTSVDHFKVKYTPTLEKIERESYQQTMNKKESGLLVKTKKGLKGRTYHSKEFIKGKVPVYLQNKDGSFKTMAMLCDPKTVTRIGFID